jgi:hypothetical protein
LGVLQIFPGIKSPKLSIFREFCEYCVRATSLLHFFQPFDRKFAKHLRSQHKNDASRLSWRIGTQAKTEKFCYTTIENFHIFITTQNKNFQLTKKSRKNSFRRHFVPNKQNFELWLAKGFHYLP